MRHVELARQLLGVPWMHQGRDPSVGIDCLYLLMYAFEVDPATEPKAYSRNPHAELMRERLTFHLGPPMDPARTPLVFGDVVEMAWGRLSRHVSIIGDDPKTKQLTLIHVDSILGKVTEHPIDAKWKRRIRGVYRL